MKPKQLKRLQIQQERLHEFDHQELDHYEEKRIGNEWFIKNFNGGTGEWQVSVYSPESYKRYKAFSEKDKWTDFKEAMERDN